MANIAKELKKELAGCKEVKTVKSNLPNFHVSDLQKVINNLPYKTDIDIKVAHFIIDAIEERQRLIDSNRELLEAANLVLTNWHSKNSNFHKKEPEYITKIRTAINNAKNIQP